MTVARPSSSCPVRRVPRREWFVARVVSAGLWGRLRDAAGGRQPGVCRSAFWGGACYTKTVTIVTFVWVIFAGRAKIA